MKSAWHAPRLDIIIRCCGVLLWKRYTHFSSLKLHQMECKINTYADDLMKSNQGKGEKGASSILNISGFDLRDVFA